jgi:hypothetical protein
VSVACFAFLSSLCPDLLARCSGGAVVMKCSDESRVCYVCGSYCLLPTNSCNEWFSKSHPSGNSVVKNILVQLSMIENDPSDDRCNRMLLPSLRACTMCRCRVVCILSVLRGCELEFHHWIAGLGLSCKHHVACKVLLYC